MFSIPLIWSNETFRDYASLDDDHQMMGDLLTKIFVNASQSTSQSELRTSCIALTEVSSEHFAREEKVLREHGYPNFGEHHSEHIALIVTLKDILGELTVSKTRANQDVQNVMLSTWLTEHMFVHDKKAAEFVLNQLAN